MPSVYRYPGRVLDAQRAPKGHEDMTLDADDGLSLSRLMTAAGTEGNGGIVKRALHAIRAHLGMEVAYVSEFVGDRTVFRSVDAPGLETLIKPGDSHSLDDVYCRHILAGRLPEIIPDTAAEPLAAAMPITQAVPIGKHMSVPIRLADGSPYGMFCCLGFAPDRSLHERDLKMMRAFADLAAFEINRDLEGRKAQEEKRVRVAALIERADLSIAYQPICDMASGDVVGFECLSRFSGAPQRGPDRWFAEAAEVGLGAELELTAIRMALSALSLLPDTTYLAVNVSPETIRRGDLHTAFVGLPAHRIVVEVTEHAQISDYDEIRAPLESLRRRGIRLAVDDAGAGYASLRHILNLRPDLIKLDMGLTRNISLDPARRALASALITFAKETQSQIIAEGVETAAELATLRALGADKAQGYHLGRPMPLAAAIARLQESQPAAHVA
jgi:EAL domain-containing protein (putative c-di-GMP-specific phosphodiesterase class I)